MSGPEIATIASRPARYFEWFLTRALLFDYEGKPELAFTHLAMAMETCGYEAARLGTPGVEPDDFTPKKYLGKANTLSRPQSFSAIDPARYEVCHELWGARHEYVHNGRFAMRPFNRSKDGTPRVPDAQLLPPHPFEKFLDAVEAATAWLVPP